MSGDRAGEALGFLTVVALFAAGYAYGPVGVLVVSGVAACVAVGAYLLRRRL